MYFTKMQDQLYVFRTSSVNDGRYISNMAGTMARYKYI